MVTTLILKRKLIMWVSVFIVLTLLSLFVKLIHNKRHCIYLKMLSQNRLILIIDRSRKIETFTCRFKALFPNVQKSMKFSDFLNMNQNLNSYQFKDLFMITADGKRFLGTSSIMDDKEIIELENITMYLKKGAIAIREYFKDFEISPLSFVVDLDGNILSLPVRFGKYWRLFDVKSIHHLKDIGISDQKFLLSVMDGKYQNGSTSIIVDGIKVFDVHGNMLDDQNVVIHLTLQGEKSSNSNVQYDVLEALVNAIDDGLMGIDRDGKIVYANDKMLKFVGRDTLKGEDVLSVFNLYDKNNRIIKLTFPLVPKVYEFAWFESPHNDTRFVVELIISEVLEADCFKIGYVLNFRDTSLRQATELKSYHFAYHDALTGVFNRHYLEEIISEMDEDVKNCGIIVVDCNGLKVINDAFGHEYGDKLIQQTANVLTNNKRDEDSVIRMGGDEFVVIIPNIEQSEFIEYTDKIRQDVSNTNINGLPLSISVGDAFHQNGSLNLNKLLSDAELKMYHDKMLSVKIANENIMNHLLNIIIERNPWEKEHSNLVRYMSEKLALEMNLGEELVKIIANAGKYHSIGKASLSTQVHLAGGDSEEFGKYYKTHTETSFRILSAMPEYSYLANTILHYKENYDGSGTPQGLKGHDIPISSRILRVASSFSKMLNPMKKENPKKSLQEAMIVMRENSGTLYGSNVIKHLETVIESKEIIEKLN